LDQAIGGLLIAAVVKEADSVSKGFATSLAVLGEQLSYGHILCTKLTRDSSEHRSVCTSYAYAPKCKLHGWRIFGSLRNLLVRGCPVISVYKFSSSHFSITRSTCHVALA
jgi:hypothetical protein